WPLPRAIGGGSTRAPSLFTVSSAINTVNTSQNSVVTRLKTFFLLMVISSLRADPLAQAHADQRSGKRQREPDPAMHAGRGDAIQESADVAAESHARAISHYQPGHRCRQQALALGDAEIRQAIPARGGQRAEDQADI